VQDAYRYFALAFDFGDRNYVARIYTDTPDEAGIVGYKEHQGVIRRDEERSRQDLAAIADYLVANEQVSRLTALTGRGYEPVPLA
jgi:hypothetical protein